MHDRTMLELLVFASRKRTKKGWWWTPKRSPALCSWLLKNEVESTEKKNDKNHMNADIPKTGGMKTGTHLG